MTNEQLIQTVKKAMRNDTVLNKGIVELLCNALVAVTEQRDALVVENAVIDSERLAWAELYGDEMGDHDVIEKAKTLQTPATDAAHASLRAEGVEMLAEKFRNELKHLGTEIIEYVEVSDHFNTAAYAADDFARQLRESKGAKK